MIPQACLALLLLASISCYVELHNQNQILAYYEQQSSKPLLHVYYNRHFRHSRQFATFEETLDELTRDHGQYMGVLFTDCDQDKQLKLSVCLQMSKTKDNRRIIGTAPSGQFRRVGSKLIQNPPSSQVLEHSRDVYTYEQLREFVLPLLPNFYQELNNKEEYQQFLLPRYSPKLLLFVRDDEEFPLVMKQLAVHYFLRIDFAFVTDLTDEITSMMQVKKYPTFVVIRYNFDASAYEYVYNPKLELVEENYAQIKQFLDGFALREPRNDLLFHKIAMRGRAEIVTAETEGELEEIKERANAWVIIDRSSGKASQKLIDLKQKYDRYFQYVNFVSEPEGKTEIYNPSENQTVPMPGELQFNSLSYQDFETNMTAWLRREIIVMGVTAQYGHICGLTEGVMFREHVKCLIIDDQDLPRLKDLMKIEFDIGFIVRVEASKKNSETNTQTSGFKISSDQYEVVYRDLDYITRIKVKQSLDNFLSSEVARIRQGQTIEQACSHPIKKCLLLVTNLAKRDRTLQSYLKQIALDYINSFIVYEVDSESNPELVREIQGIKDNKADIVVYYPRTAEFTKLNKKVTKNLIAQFFKANLKNDRRLIRHDGAALSKLVVHSSLQDSEQL